MEEGNKNFVAQEVRVSRKKRLVLPKLSGKGITIAAAVLVVAVGVFCVLKFVVNPSTANGVTEKMGESYYSDFFYGQVTSSMDDEKKAEFLKKSESTGLSVSVENLLRFAQHNKSEDEYNKFEKAVKKCNADASKVVITPEEPFGATDFKIEVKLECE
jgi:hypothetical protein